MDRAKTKRDFPTRIRKKQYLKSLFYFFVFVLVLNSFLWANTIWIERNQTFIQVPINWTPTKPQEKVFYFDQWKLIIYCKSFSRGEIFYIEILPKDDSPNVVLKDYTHQVYYKTIERNIPLNQKSFGYNGIYVFPPELKEPKNKFIWIIQNPNKEKIQKEIELNIYLREFPYSDTPLIFEKKILPPEKQKELDERIKKEREIKKIAFSENLPNLFSNRLSHPRDFHYITSEWYKTRIHQYYQIINKKKIFSQPYKSIHKGLDLKGNTGDIVYALADGKIVLSAEMYYEGNFILINHGNKIFSGYMHLNERYYPENTYVKAGIPIGTVGATGLAIGSHLHFSVWIDGIVADPLSIYSLPIR